MDAIEKRGVIIRHLYDAPNGVRFVAQVIDPMDELYISGPFWDLNLAYEAKGYQFAGVESVSLGGFEVT